MRTIGIPELVVIAAVILFLLPAIFYLISLQKALERCAPQCRTMPPGQVWLLLIPLFGLVWHFIIVERMASSLRNEFVRRRMPLADPEPGKALGIAMCVLFAACLVPSPRRLRRPGCLRLLDSLLGQDRGLLPADRAAVLSLSRRLFELAEAGFQVLL